MLKYELDFRIAESGKYLNSAISEKRKNGTEGLERNEA